jgi:histidinol phosphatase-like PHP family hydrolase
VDVAPDERRDFDLVVAAPHSSLRKSDPQTERMLAAVRTAGVHILGHPRGRIYGSRPGITADWPRVFAAAAENGVAVEIDGDPFRQDLDFALARHAIDTGCLFALDSDAHAIDQWWYADVALAHARPRGRPPRPYRQLLAARSSSRVGQRQVRHASAAVRRGGGDGYGLPPT